MSTVNVTIGAKNEMAGGLAKAKRDVQQWSKEVSQATNRAMSGGGAGGGRAGQRLGQVSMQAQDIAVQLQMGTSKMQIFAQQGSQLLSVFGPAGAILGGLAAVGGAMATVGIKGMEALENMRIESDQLISSLEKAGKTGDFDTIATAIAAGSKEMNGLKKSAQDAGGIMTSVSNYWKSVFDGGSLMGGSDAAKEKEVGAKLKAMEANEQMIRLEGALLQSAEERATLAERMVGMTDEQVAALERQKKLEKEIAAIEATSFQESTKEGLKAAAIRKSEAEGEKAQAKKDEQRAKEREKRNEDFIKDTQAEAAQAIDDEMNPGAAKARKKADRARERAAEKVIDQQIKKEERDARTDGFKDFGKTADKIQKERRDRKKGLVDAALGKGGDDVGANTGKILGIMQGLKDLLVKK